MDTRCQLPCRLTELWIKPGRWAFQTVLVALLIVGGCRKESKEPSIVQLEGKIERITARPDGTGEIILVYTDKRGEPAKGIGEVTPETEIMINGAVAKLQDIREGEHVRGQVQIDKKHKDRKPIAVSIHVDRAQPVKPD